MDATRRGFLRGLAGVAATAAAAGTPLTAVGAPAMPARAFGRTGRKVSLFGLGSFPLGSLASETAGVQVALHALKAGCTYVDTAPSYARGRSEQRVGLALKEWGRERVFLSTKTHTRTADDAARDLEGSLKRLQVDRIDLVQVHAIKDAADLARALDPKRGPLAALHKAKEQGVLRYIGVTGHYDPQVMAETFRRYAFDSILIPLNCVDPHQRSFVDQALPAACANGLARVAMKVFASGNLPREGVDPVRCLRFTYGLDVSTVIVGCRTVGEVDVAAKTARTFVPLTDKEKAALVASTRPHAGGKVEWYKRKK